MKNVLMVCRGNICRSPMAQFIAQQLAASVGLSKKFKFESAGTHAPHVKSPVDPRVLTTLTRYGYSSLRHYSRIFLKSDFQNFDLILAMDLSILEELQHHCPPEHIAKLALFLKFSGNEGESEIIDPYYGSIEGFEQTLRLCETGAKGLIQRMNSCRYSGN